MTAFRCLWLLGMLQLALSCGGAASSNLASNVDSLPAAFTSAQCDFNVRCRLQPDTATCQQASGAPVRLLTLVSSLRRGRTVYDSRQMADCIGIIQASDCSVEGQLEILGACADAFQGLVATGQSCVDSRECASGVCNVSACGQLCCPGTCALAIQGDAGPPSEGAACDDVRRCPLPLVCSAGICRKLPNRGEPCDPAVGLVVCDRVDDYCDPVSQVCLALASDGDACVPPDPATVSTGTCVVDAWCDGGRCSPRPTLGQPCTTASGCTTGLCDSMTSVCVPAPTVTVCPL